MKEEKTYAIDLHCINCRRWVRVQIPLGMKLLVYLKSNTCENCGCTFVKNITEFKLIFPEILSGEEGQWGRND